MSRNNTIWVAKDALTQEFRKNEFRREATTIAFLGAALLDKLLKPQFGVYTH